ncbi:recombination mediator RecR [bacterium]|nr:recombination mediator RecR [bacterium]
MVYYTESLDKLVKELGKLPGIGSRSAQKMAFHLLKIPKEEARELAQAIVDIKEKTRYCSICNNFSEGKYCPICIDPGRDKSIICVIEEPNDIIAIEKIGVYKGTYHVLMGAISPLDGIGPDELRIKELLGRISADVKEVILATNPNTEGEATAMYLGKIIKPLGTKVTRIARGIPVGGNIEYTDQATLAKAMEKRGEI